MAIAVECEQPHVSFLVLEEIPGHHFLTLKQLTDQVFSSHNFAEYFKEKTYAFDFLIQSLQAIAFK